MASGIGRRVAAVERVTMPERLARFRAAMHARFAWCYADDPDRLARLQSAVRAVPEGEAAEAMQRLPDDDLQWLLPAGWLPWFRSGGYGWPPTPDGAP